MQSSRKPAVPGYRIHILLTNLPEPGDETVPNGLRQSLNQSNYGPVRPNVRAPVRVFRSSSNALTSSNFAANQANKFASTHFGDSLSVRLCVRLLRRQIGGGGGKC